MAYIPPDLWQPVGVESLERIAEDAVRSNQNTLIVAGPGAGKTELLAQRASFLLDTAICPSPRRILAISFKRNAAKILAERVRKRCDERAERFDSFTLDSFAKGIVDRFRLALREDWRPKESYQVMVKAPRIEVIRDWFKKNRNTKYKVDQLKDREIEREFDQLCHGQALSYADDDIRKLYRELSLRWWQEPLDLSPNEPCLSFPMLNRLAAFIIRENPKLRTALRATYNFVFLDEFQDTTTAQYDLIGAAFHGSNTVLTAVGDSKQRIMLWAGAMPDVFNAFEADYGATRRHLVRNYRSVPELVRMQQVIAEALEAGTPNVTAARTDSSGGCAILEFRNSEEEADYIAALIERRMNSDGARPRDFCVIVRQRISDMIKPLQLSLSNRGIKLRDESQLQDLLVEPVVDFLIAILRLATRQRDAEAWESLTNEIAQLFGIVEDDTAKIEQEAQKLICYAGTALNEGIPISKTLSILVSMVGDQAFRAVHRQYSNGTYLQDKITALAETLEKLAGKSVSMYEAVNDVLGVDAIPAITIHKSKGLEFNTVIFLGLEDSQWWGFSKEPDEEKRGFFVAFSRAIEHVYFTYSDLRDNGRGSRPQQKEEIDSLYTILHQAGVESINCRNQTR